MSEQRTEEGSMMGPESLAEGLDMPGCAEHLKRSGLQRNGNHEELHFLCSLQITLQGFNFPGRQHFAVSKVQVRAKVFMDSGASKS